MMEEGSFYKVICVKIDPFYSEIIDEQNFGTQQEAHEFVKAADPAKMITLVFRIPQESLAITS